MALLGTLLHIRHVFCHDTSGIRDIYIYLQMNIFPPEYLHESAFCLNDLRCLNVIFVYKTGGT